MSLDPSSHVIWLSHPWGPSCPAYAGGSRVELTSVQSITQGATSNSLKFTAGNHIGTHMDAPRHFIIDGRTVDCYSPRELIFLKPFVLDVKLGSLRRHISSEDFETLTPKEISSFKDCDILLLRTGAELFRNDDRYWNDGPGLDSGLAAYIRRTAPQCRAVGIDAISITAFCDREKGRAVHREFLGCTSPFILLEDMALNELKGKTLAKVIVAPLRIESGDGAPVTVMGFMA